MDVVIFGAGGFAKTVSEWLLDASDAGRGLDFIGFLDSSEEKWGREMMGRRVLGGIDWLRANRGVGCIVAVGNANSRSKVAQALDALDVPRPNLIHPRATVCRSARISEGAILCPNVSIGAEATVGRHAILNIGSVLGHDSVVGDYVHLSPGVYVSGNVKVGSRSDLGTSSAAIQGVSIGNDCVIGAGAVVTMDIGSGSTAVGVPAKVIKTRPIDDP